MESGMMELPKSAEILNAAELIEHSKTQKLPVFKLTSKKNLPENTAEEEEQLKKLWEVREGVLKRMKVSRVKDLMRAEWDAHLKQSVTSQLKGKLVQHMGRWSNGKFCFTPYETVFLMEAGFLELFHGDMPVSIEEAFVLAFGNDLSLEKYQVFCFLTRLGYIVVPHQKMLDLKVADKNSNVKAQSMKHNEETNLQRKSSPAGDHRDHDVVDMDCESQDSCEDSASDQNRASPLNLSMNSSGNSVVQNENNEFDHTINNTEERSSQNGVPDHEKQSSEPHSCTDEGVCVNEISESFLEDTRTSNLKVNTDIECPSENTMQETVTLDSSVESIKEQDLRYENCVEDCKKLEHTIELDLTDDNEQDHAIEVDTTDDKEQEHTIEVDATDDKDQDHSIEVDTADDKEQDHTIEVDAANDKKQDHSIEVDTADVKEQGQAIEVDAADDEEKDHTVEVDTSDDKELDLTLKKHDGKKLTTEIEHLDKKCSKFSEELEPCEVMISSVHECNVESSVIDDEIETVSEECDQSCIVIDDDTSSSDSSSNHSTIEECSVENIAGDECVLDEEFTVDDDKKKLIPLLTGKSKVTPNLEDEVVFLEVKKRESKPLAVIDLSSDSDSDQEQESVSDEVQITETVMETGRQGTSRINSGGVINKCFGKHKDQYKSLPKKGKSSSGQWPFPDFAGKNIICLPRPPAELLPPNVTPAKNIYPIDIDALLNCSYDGIKQRNNSNNWNYSRGNRYNSFHSKRPPPDAPSTGIIELIEKAKHSSYNSSPVQNLPYASGQKLPYVSASGQNLPYTSASRQNFPYASTPAQNFPSSSTHMQNVVYPPVQNLTYSAVPNLSNDLPRVEQGFSSWFPSWTPQQNFHPSQVPFRAVNSLVNASKFLGDNTTFGQTSEMRTGDYDNRSYNRGNTTNFKHRDVGEMFDNHNRQGVYQYKNHRNNHRGKRYCKEVDEVTCPPAARQNFSGTKGFSGSSTYKHRPENRKFEFSGKSKHHASDKSSQLNYRTQKYSGSTESPHNSCEPQDSSRPARPYSRHPPQWQPRKKNTHFPYKNRYREQSKDMVYPSAVERVPRNVSSWTDYRTALKKIAEPAKESTSLPSVKIDEVLWSRDIHPLLRPTNMLPVSDVLELLSITHSINLIMGNNSNSKRFSSKVSNFEISFDVFLPGSNYKKRAPGIPSHRIIVTRSTDAFPKLADFVAVTRGCSDRALLQFAVVDGGDISFFSFNDISLQTLYPSECSA